MADFDPRSAVSLAVGPLVAGLALHDEVGHSRGRVRGLGTHFIHFSVFFYHFLSHSHIRDLISWKDVKSFDSLTAFSAVAPRKKTRLAETCMYASQHRNLITPIYPHKRERSSFDIF